MLVNADSLIEPQETMFAGLRLPAPEDIVAIDEGTPITVVNSVYQVAPFSMIILISEFSR